MPSKNPKIQGYVAKNVYARFEQWKQENECQSTSVALDQILWQFFALDREQAKQEKEEVQEFFPKLKEELKQEILAEVNHQLEAIDKRIGEIEAQFEQERESPQLGINQEAMETVWMQEEVIRELQAEIDSLKESPEESPEEISLEDCQQKAIAILEAQFGQLSKAKLELYPEAQLMDIIFITSPLLNIEQAEEILRRILAAIPATPPLHEILGTEEDEVELNLEGDSPQESPQKSPLEELSHGELVQRLKSNKNTLRSKRNQPGFASWAQQRDNRGLIWRWDSERKIYQGFRANPV